MTDDPDHSPLTGNEVWASGRARITARIAARDAKVAPRDERKVETLPEYTYVKLARPFRSLPIGAEGTILMVYPETHTYMVEFFAPVRSVETVAMDLIEPSNDDDEVREVRARMWRTATGDLTARGHGKVEAVAIAARVLLGASPFPLPTIDELDAEDGAQP